MTSAAGVWPILIAAAVMFAPTISAPVTPAPPPSASAASAAQSPPAVSTPAVSAGTGAVDIALASAIAAAGDPVHMSGTGPPGWGPCQVTLDGQEPPDPSCSVSDSGSIQISFTAPSTIKFGKHTVQVCGCSAVVARAMLLTQPPWSAHTSLTIDTRVPDVTGRRLRDATAALRAASLIGAAPDGTPADTLIAGQHPNPATLVQPGTTITLDPTAADNSPAAPAVVRVPRVTGLTLPAARAALTRAGLHLVYTGDPHGTVRGQQPAAGSPAPPDHTIALTLTAAAAAATPTTSTWWPIAVPVLGLLAALALGLTLLHHLARTRARMWARQHITLQAWRPLFAVSAHPPSGRRPDQCWTVAAVPVSRIVAVTQEHR